jgi:hypothetical protein
MTAPFLSSTRPRGASGASCIPRREWQPRLRAGWDPRDRVIRRDRPALEPLDRTRGRASRPPPGKLTPALSPGATSRAKNGPGSSAATAIRPYVRGSRLGSSRSTPCGAQIRSTCKSGHSSA